MNTAHLKRVLNLVRTLSEHVIIADPESNDLFVVMQLDEYESLAGISSEDEEDFLVGTAHSTSTIRPVQPAPLLPLKQLETTVSKKIVPEPVAEAIAPDQLDFTDDAWKNDWESAFLAEHPETIPAEEEEEEKFYLEPLE